MVWTRFHDMSSGGGQKHVFNYIYIEAPEKEAKVIFFNRFGTNPERVSCTCCGEDYIIDESETLKQASAYERGCRNVQKKRVNGRYQPLPEGVDYYLENDEEPPEGFEVERSYRNNDYMTLEEYVEKGGSGDWAFIFAKDIKSEERQGSVSDQGYVWVD